MPYDLKFFGNKCVLNVKCSLNNCPSIELKVSSIHYFISFKVMEKDTAFMKEVDRDRVMKNEGNKRRILMEVREMAEET